jgi:regulator of sigma E protease
VLTILATIVALSVLILIHEFGHFFAAKLVGIHAPRFSLGLGPRVTGASGGARPSSSSPPSRWAAT